jgi:hypothetical protein
MGAGSIHLSVTMRGPGAATQRRRTRRGYMLFEVQMAFLVLGIGLAGLCPLVVMQLRQVRQLEKRMHGDVTIAGKSQPMVFMKDTNPQIVLPTPYYFIVPWQNPWAQKLAGSAQILASFPDVPGDIPPNVSAIPCDYGPLLPPATVGVKNNVTVLVDGFTIPPSSQSMSVYVDVSLK